MSLLLPILALAFPFAIKWLLINRMPWPPIFKKIAEDVTKLVDGFAFLGIASVSHNTLLFWECAVFISLVVTSTSITVIREVTGILRYRRAQLTSR